MTDDSTKPTLEPFDDDELIGQALADAIGYALERHRRLGHSIAVWRDGRVVELGPDEIPPYPPPKANEPDVNGKT